MTIPSKNHHSNDLQVDTTGNNVIPSQTKKFDFPELKDLVASGNTRSKAWRIQQLNRIQKLLELHEDEILNALFLDLGKPSTEAFFEIIALKQELNLTLKNLSRWMRPKRIPVPIYQQPGQALIQPEPLGCVLIIGPWNYPFSLTLQPFISALAAGNTVVLKPSENAPSTSKLISNLIKNHFDKNIAVVIEGDSSIAAELVGQPFDHIFFTGGSSIGSKVLAASAKNLTPVTLELGGKSPAIVIKGADIEVTAKRLIWGKSLNAGQTCIAPDHLLVEKQLKKPLLKAMSNARREFYGSNPLESTHLARIINKFHFQRLKQLLDNAKENNQIICGGEVNEDRRMIAPTLIEVKDRNDPLMAEELFGPLLPILTVSNLSDAIDEVRQQPKPLALYMFGGTEKEQEALINGTSSGGVCFNDVVMHAGIPELPFGGIGPSGMGSYHGLAGFETFSHLKSILRRSFSMDLKFRYPPYGNELKWMKRLMS